MAADCHVINECLHMYLRETFPFFIFFAFGGGKVRDGKRIGGKQRIKKNQEKEKEKENGPSKWLLMSGARLPAPSGQKKK